MFLPSYLLYILTAFCKHDTLEPRNACNCIEAVTIKMMNQMVELRILREELGLNRTEFSILYDIPLRTLEDWEHTRRTMPPYLLRLLVYKVKMDALLGISIKETKKESANSNINVITDVDGRKVVLINDIRFKSRRNINWNEIEEYLKEYIGCFFEIEESSEKIYIGGDFPDEFVHSNDTIHLQGANEKAKANMVTAIGDLIQIATKKMAYPDYVGKHKTKAKHGWYRYDTRFGIPMYDESGELKNYNIFTTRMLVRCDANGKLYLYDFVRTKKETSSPLEQ